MFDWVNTPLKRLEIQRIAFLVIVYVSYSRNKLIKFDTSSIRCNVFHSPFIIITGKAPHQSTNYGICVYDNRKCASVKI